MADGQNNAKNNLKIEYLTYERFKTCNRVQSLKAFAQAIASIMNVTVIKLMNANTIMMTRLSSHPVLANTDGNVNAPVPTIKLNTNTSPICKKFSN